MLRPSILIILAVLFLSCSQQKTTSELSTNSFKVDSLALDSLHLTKAYTLSSRHQSVAGIMKLLPDIKDSITLAKAYYHIAMYMNYRNYDKAKYYHNKARRIFRRYNRWEDLMNLNGSYARMFRNNAMIDSIEPLLLDNIKEIELEGVKSFAILYPLHELSVHYSYDLGKYHEAIKYGELFFERLAHFDSLPIKNHHFDDLRYFKKDVIDLILGVAYAKVGQLNNSEKHLKEAYKNYTKRKDEEKLVRVHKGFIELYALKNDVEKLIYHKDKYYEATKKYLNTFSKNEKDVHLLEVALMEEDKKRQSIEDEFKIKSLITYGSMLILLCLGLFQWYSTKLKREKREVALKLEKQYEFNNFKTNVLLTVAHELRTPLTLILGHLQLISNQQIEPENFKLYINKIKNSSQGILNRMSDIIRLLKDEKTKTTISTQNLNILPFLKKVFFNFEGAALMKNIQLIFTAQLPTNHTINSDPKILTGILNNLIHNAIKFSNPDSEIKMVVSHTSETLSIQIIDHGIGIDDLNKKYIFDKFNRAETGANIDGFGIGLAIVKEYTELLNGNIQVESIIQQGSTFTLTLPNQSTIINFEEKSQPKSEKSKNNKPKKLLNKSLNKLLVVEDNAEMCSFYKQIFDKFYECSFAFNGVQAINMLKNNGYDLILSDVMMPEMDGFELKEKVRKMNNREHIPFVFVTAKDKDESKIKAFNIGVDDYIVKPFNKDELIARINSLINNKKAREKWSSSNGEDISTETSSIDVKTVKKLQEIVLKNCDNENFGVTELANEIGLSQRQLIRVIKKLTGLTPVKFILEVRLLEAYRKIKNKEEVDINNVRFSVGIQSASYFSTQFKKRFGLNPNELLKFHKDEFISLEE